MKHRLAEYFLVVGYGKQLTLKDNTDDGRSFATKKFPNNKTPDGSKDPFDGMQFLPDVIDRWPKRDHQDTALEEAQLHQFCLPTGLYVTPHEELPEYYTFTWTLSGQRVGGQRVYGSCLRFVEPVKEEDL